MPPLIADRVLSGLSNIVFRVMVGVGFKLTTLLKQAPNASTNESLYKMKTGTN